MAPDGQAVDGQAAADGQTAPDGQAVDGAADTYVPALEPLDFAALLTSHTAVYYYPVGEGEIIEDSAQITGWKKVKKDTVLGPNDLLRVYLAYTIPAGSLNETNPVARYRLPANLHLSDGQVKGINAVENGIAAAYIDYNTLSVLDVDNYHKYLGAEAVEGTRTPDRDVNEYLQSIGGNGADAQEFISATVQVEAANGAGSGNASGQELVFTFSPYTIEKNQHTYDASGQPTRAGEKVHGWFTLDFNLRQVDWDQEEVHEQIEEITGEGNVENAEDVEVAAIEEGDKAADSAESAVDDTALTENAPAGDAPAENTTVEDASAENPASEELVTVRTVTVTTTTERTTEIRFRAEGHDEVLGNYDELSTTLHMEEKAVTVEEIRETVADQGSENEQNADPEAGQSADPEADPNENQTEETEDPEAQAEGENGEDAEAAADGEEGKTVFFLNDPEDGEDKEQEKDDEKKQEQEDPANYPARSFNDTIVIRTGSLSTDSANSTIPEEAELTVYVEAGKGTFPEGTTMVLSAVDGTHEKEVVDALENAVDSTARTSGFQAVDITFYNADGKEIEPLQPIRVSMHSEAIRKALEDNYTAPVVMHIEDPTRDVETTAEEAASDNTKEEADAESLDTSGNAAGDPDADPVDTDETDAESNQEKSNEDSRGSEHAPADHDKKGGGEIVAREVEAAPTDQNEKTTHQGGSADGLTFEANDFSVYAIVYTVDFHWGVNGRMYEFSLHGGDSISIRDLVGALGVIDQNVEAEWKEYYQVETGEEGEGTDGNSRSTETQFINKIEEIRFSAPDLIWVGKSTGEMTAAEIAEENGLAVEYSGFLTSEQIAELQSKSYADGEWVLLSLKPFATEEVLTVVMNTGEEFTIWVTDAQQIRKVITTSDETLQVTVEAHDEMDVARFEDLRVEELAPDTEAYTEAYQAVVSLKDVQDENFNRDHCGFFAANIELLDQDGEAFEPSGRVSVKMEWIRSPAEESVPTSTMEIQHLVRQDGRIDVQTVASGDQISKVDEGIAAKFFVESFSTFTLTWTDEGSSNVISDQNATTTLNIQNGSGETYASVTIHYVDTNGNNIRSPFSTAVTGTTPVAVEGLLNSEIEGYEYQGAHFNSYDGKGIQSMAVTREQGTETGDIFTYLGTTSLGGRINGSSSAPAGYTEFYADDQGATRIYFRNQRFRTTDNNYGPYYVNGPVYGKTTGNITNYQFVLSFDNSEIDPLENVSLTKTWNNAADIYLVYEDTDPNKSHATIHYGTLGDDGSFEELQDAVMLDTDAASISLNATISGYEFVGAYYSATETSTPASETQQILPVLRKVDDVWQYKDVNTAEQAGVEDGSHIYVSYKEKTTHGTPTPDDSELPAPATVKKVTSNLDGTYDIQLDIIGQRIEETNRKGANVLLIFDRTSSMSGSMTNAPGNGQRIDAAKQAVHTLVNALNPSVNPVEIAVYSFDRFVNDPYTTDGGSYWTSDGQAITDFTDALTLAPSGAGGGKNGGTNWEAALEQAATVLETADEDPTYVIFLTDGNPTIHNGNCNNDGGINSSPTADSDVYTRARTAAGNLDPKYKIYGVLCANQSDGPLLKTLVDYLNDHDHDATHILADDGTTLTNTFNNIAEYIVNQLGTGDVSTNDGITSLSSVNAAVSGAAGAFQYYKAYEVTYKDNKYTYVDDNGTVQEIADASQVNTYNYQDSQGNPKTYLYYNRFVWDDAPGASYSEAAGVTWDLGAVGLLQEGAIYSIRFTIWPSQEAYDLLADLNNGIKVYEAGHENSITESERGQVYESGGVYYMKTNTNLDTSYSVGEHSYTDSIDYYQGAMDLDTRTISLEKLWPDNFLDSYGPGQSLEGIQKQVTLTVTKDGEDYLDVTLEKDNGWKEENVYISCGLLTVHNGVVEIKEPGHDYTVTEPESFSYYWDLVSDVYRPMVIGYDGENGTVHEAALLVLDETMTEADNVNSFEINGKIYKKQGVGNSTLNARNYRRANLNLQKHVTGFNAPKDAYFEYTVKIKDPAGDDIWFSAMDGDVYQILETSSNVTPEYRTVEGAVYNPYDKTYTYTYDGQVYTLFAADDGTGGKMYTGFYHVSSDDEFTVKIKEGWNIRFINLPHGSTFSITESDMDEGFSFVEIGTDTLYDFTLVDPATVWNQTEGETITGTIVEPNNSYTVTYTNKWESVDFLLEKVKEDRETRISGAVFDLEAKEEHGCWIKILNGIKPGGTGTVIDEMTGAATNVDIGNPVNIGGLGIGHYRFVETIAPDGYVILTKNTYFEVYKDETVLKARLTDEDGVPLVDEDEQEITETDIAKLSTEVIDGTTVYKITITNTPGAALPNTGGPGTRLFTILGYLLIAGAGLLLWRRRRLS
ncbi:MAG: VWA domain-containing protein [Eubacteriales bacterium]|nr:VWA domain-containing protein [Eubacteriales bacterium]